MPSKMENAGRVSFHGKQSGRRGRIARVNSRDQAQAVQVCELRQQGHHKDGTATR